MALAVRPYPASSDHLSENQPSSSDRIPGSSLHCPVKPIVQLRRDRTLRPRHILYQSWIWSNQPPLKWRSLIRRLLLRHELQIEKCLKLIYFGCLLGLLIYWL
jgi:hypothetical protein